MLQHSPFAGILHKRFHDPLSKSWTTPQARKQGIANVDFVINYQYILLAGLAVLTIRNFYQYLRKRHRRYQLAILTGPVPPEKQIRAETEEALVGWGAVFDSWLFYPLEQKWYWFRLENPLQVAFVVVVVVVNLAFVLSIDKLTGQQSKFLNKWSVMALRAGFMSMAQFPAVLALTGRNSIVCYLTGIDYMHLRFAHKLFALVLGFLGLLHTIDVLVQHAKWNGNGAVHALWSENTYGKTGVIMIVGLAVSGLSALRMIRARWYEAFLIFHIIGAILLLVGIALHVPVLAAWVAIPAGFWVLERFLRLAQLFSIRLLVRFKFRAPLIQAHATLIEGAIVLRVPFKGTWKAGQHAYISVWDMSFIRTPQIYGQTHPFSIANVPSSAETNGRYHEMMFVMRTRTGMTSIIEKRLACATNGASPIIVSVEGPYGNPVDTENYQEVLLVAGGSGISHVMSMTADIIHRAQTRFTRNKAVRVVWAVQTVEQSIWCLTDLLLSVKKAADAGVDMSIELYVSKGALTRPMARTPFNASVESFDSMSKGKGKEVASHVEEVKEEDSRSNRASIADLDALMASNPSAYSLAVIPGRPPLEGLVPAFIAGSQGKSLVVACGPSAMVHTVRKEHNKMMRMWPSDLQVAVFEC